MPAQGGRLLNSCQTHCPITVQLISFRMAEDQAEQGGEGTVLATMLPVDPFELPQAEPLALTTSRDGQENKPSFILQLLLLDEEGKVRDQKDPLTDASNSQLR